MNIRKIISILLYAFSCSVFAEQVPVLFEQAINISPNQTYTVHLEDVSASDQIWTAVYLIAKQNYPGPTSKVDFVIENQGLLNKKNPSEHQIISTLVAEELTQPHDYTFDHFKGLKKWIEKATDQEIENPTLEETDLIRVYSQVNDWIPEYDSYEPTQVSISFQNPIDLEVVAAYILVGKGEKPAQLAELNFKSSHMSAIDESAVPTQTIAPTRSERHITRFNIKLIFLLGSALTCAFFAFIYRKKLRRYY